MAAARGASTAPVAPTPSVWRSRRLGVALLALSAVFFGVNFAQEWWVSHQVQQQAASLRQQIGAQNALNAQLQSQISYYGSRQYIITRARQIGMSFPGDTLMQVVQQPTRYKTIRVPAPAQPQSQGFLSGLLHAIFH